MASARPASQGSGSEQETPHGQSCFVIPCAINDCDDVLSPSLHRLSYASQRSQACLDCISDDKDQVDDTHSEEEGDAKVSNSSGGEEDEEEEEEEEESEKSDEEEQDEDNDQGDDLSDASEVASSRAPSKQQSSQKQLAMLVRNLQKVVEILKSNSQAQPVDELSSLNLHKQSRIPLPAVQDDEEATGCVDQIMETTLTQPKFELQGRECNLDSYYQLSFFRSINAQRDQNMVSHDGK
jgi:hypothetical protein